MSTLLFNPASAVLQVEPDPPPPILQNPPSLPPAEPASVPAETPSTFASDVQERIDQLSLEQKIGQLMMVGFAGTEMDATIEALVRGRQVGGVCLFKRNILNADQVAHLNDDVRALLAQKIPPFIAVDQEGGNVVRIQDRIVVLPGNMALGATRSRKLAYEAGREQAEALKLLGFNMNLAPVLDVNLNPRNPVIGIRSFGDDPALVSEFGAEFVRGQQDANLVTIAKHFPGHGSTDADSHRSLPVMHETAAKVFAQMAPFEAVIQQGLDGLMTAHVAVPALTGNDEPATVSHAILTDLLRKKMKFDGLVLTDELEMEAIAQRFGVGRAAVLSIGAGADMVLVPWHPEAKTEVYRSLLAAAQAGELPMARINDAVRHILSAKVRRGLFEPQPPLAERLEKLSSTHSDVDRRIARGSVTLLRADARIFPIPAGKRITVITAEETLGRAILERAGGGSLLTVPAYASLARRADARRRTRELALESDIVVVGVINSRQLELVTLAAAAGKPVIVVSMGLPYLVELVPEARVVLALYSYRQVSARAAAAVLFGDEDTPGKLPVALRHFPFGFGLTSTPPKALSAAQTQP